MAVLQHIPGDSDEASPADGNQAVRYYLIPCLFLFERCERLLNVVLDEMASLVLSKDHAPGCSHIVREIVYFLQLINEDTKSREMLTRSKPEIENLLKKISLLQVRNVVVPWGNHLLKSDDALFTFILSQYLLTLSSNFLGSMLMGT